MYHIFFIHSSADGHLGCFHVSAIVNSAAMNTGVQVSFQIRVFLGYMPRSGISGSHGNSRQLFKGTPPLDLRPFPCLKCNRDVWRGCGDGPVHRMKAQGGEGRAGKWRDPSLLGSLPSCSSPEHVSLAYPLREKMNHLFLRAGKCVLNCNHMH